MVGVFDSGMYDYDTTLAYMALADAQRFFDMKDGVTGIEVRVHDVYGAREVARAHRADARRLPVPRPRLDGGEPQPLLGLQAREGRLLHRALLIVVVAAFNILATLTMVVKEKRRDIAILKSMGAIERRRSRASSS